MASYFVGYKRRYPALNEVTLPAFNLPGLSAYAIGSAVAYYSTWIAPVVGVLTAALSYGLLLLVSEAVRERRAQLLRAM